MWQKEPKGFLLFWMCYYCDTVLLIGMNMNGKPVKSIFFGKPVWVNLFMESFRQRECLCFSCVNLRPNMSDNCQIAQSFYEICVKEDVALAVTRCPLWRSKDSQ